MSVLRSAGLFAAAGALLLAAAMPVGAAGPADHSYRTSPSAISGEVGAFFFSGFTVTGSNCDDCTTPITFPFPLTFYGQTYTSGLAGANGNLQLTGDSTSLSSGCLPNAELGAAIMPFQRDLRTNGTNDHISTRVTGTSPNRLFGIAWVTHFFVSADTATFGVLFRENDPRIEIAERRRHAGACAANAGCRRRRLTLLKPLDH